MVCSDILQDIIRSITKPAPQLGIVLYTFIVTVVIYASFGLEYFEEFFVYDEYDDEQPEQRGCHSVVACFWLIFYHGVPAGELSDVLDNVDNRRPSLYLWRLLFDLTFFVWVGILLFNVITGLMVDTFSALREDAADRADKFENECFVCGLSRDKYDDDYATIGPSFDQHKEVDHNRWMYLQYMSYIKAKNHTEYNGVETYVNDKLDQQDQSWIPSRTSFAIQNLALKVDEEDEVVGQINAHVDERTTQLDDKLADLTTLVGTLLDRS